MRKFVSILLIILFVNFCFGTTVYLRKGGTIEGEVISKDDEKFVLKTAEGEKTIKWRSVKNKSIKEIYPELYEALKAQAIERKNKKKKKKPAEKNKPDLSRVQLKVETNESAGSYKKYKLEERNKLFKFFRKACIGKINIKISNLDPKKEYTLKTVYSRYIKLENDLNTNIKKTPDDRNIVKEENLYGKRNYEIEIDTLPYYFYKVKPRAGIRVKKKGGGSKLEFGDKLNGWDISIWLNDILVYEKKKGEVAVYHNNISH